MKSLPPSEYSKGSSVTTSDMLQQQGTVEHQFSPGASAREIDTSSSSYIPSDGIISKNENIEVQSRDYLMESFLSRKNSDGSNRIDAISCRLHTIINSLDDITQLHEIKKHLESHLSYLNNDNASGLSVSMNGYRREIIDTCGYLLGVTKSKLDLLGSEENLQLDPRKPNAKSDNFPKISQALLSVGQSIKAILQTPRQSWVTDNSIVLAMKRTDPAEMKFNHRAKLVKVHLLAGKKSIGKVLGETREKYNQFMGTLPSKNQSGKSLVDSNIQVTASSELLGKQGSSEINNYKKCHTVSDKNEADADSIQNDRPANNQTALKNQSEPDFLLEAEKKSSSQSSQVNIKKEQAIAPISDDRMHIQQPISFDKNPQEIFKKIEQEIIDISLCLKNKIPPHLIEQQILSVSSTLTRLEYSFKNTLPKPANICKSLEKIQAYRNQLVTEKILVNLNKLFNKLISLLKDLNSFSTNTTPGYMKVGGIQNQPLFLKKVEKNFGEIDGILSKILDWNRQNPCMEKDKIKATLTIVRDVLNSLEKASDKKPPFIIAENIASLRARKVSLENAYVAAEKACELWKSSNFKGQFTGGEGS